MKKRYIAMISISSILLLFGGLIYCGISAFPELLKEEEEVTIIEEKQVTQVTQQHNYHNETNEEAVVTHASNHSSNDNHYVPKSDEHVIVIDVASHTVKNNEEIKNGITGKKTAKSKDSFVATLKDEISHSSGPIKNEKVEYSLSHYTNSVSKIEKSEKVLNKENRLEVINNEKTSHQEVTECSLLVVGAVGVLSFILRNKKKRLFHR